MKITTELEPKYIVQATELRKIKDGRYHRNMWMWILRTYLNLSLRKRLHRLEEDYKDNKISLAEFKSYQSIINSAI